MELTARQHAHILAALRYTQDINLSDLPHFDDIEQGCLSDQEVDDLIESLNYHGNFVLSKEEMTGNRPKDLRDEFIFRAFGEFTEETIEVMDCGHSGVWLSDDGDGPQGAWVEARLYIDGEGLLYPEGGEPGDEMPEEQS